MTFASPEESEIRAVIEAWASALRDRDAVRLLGTYASDAVNFDIAPPLRLKSADVLNPKGLEEWFATWSGPIGVEHRDTQLFVGGDLALVHGLINLAGPRTSGDETDVWIRQSLGFRRCNDGWRIIHEHTSVPFYMDGSYRAAVDLRP